MADIAPTIYPTEKSACDNTLSTLSNHGSPSPAGMPHTAVTVTNHGGGINGGITNGMPIVFSCAVKPAASIHIEQNTVNFLNGTNEKITVNGRHDPCIVRRAVPVINAITAFVVCDLLALRFGTDVLAEGISDKAK